MNPTMVRAATAERTIVDLVNRGTGREWSVEVRPFEIASTTVTRQQWATVIGSAVVGSTVSGADAQLPVVEVSWRDAITFCNRLSQRAGLVPAYDIEVLDIEPARHWVPHDRPAPDEWDVHWRRDADGYRLPSEAEWQLACRAGTTGPRYGPLDEIAWYAGNSGDRIRAVGLKTPNAWGIHDMLGGVWEWCWDLFDSGVYGAYRVIRGGGWADPAWSCRAGVRRKTQPNARLDDIGLRLARSLA